MIFDTDNKAKVQTSLGSAAKRELNQTLSRIYKSGTQIWLNHQLNQIHNKRVLHLFCGHGVESNIIASLLDEQSSLLGLDPDAVMIEASRNTTIDSGNINANYLVCDPFSWSGTQAFDYLYTRIIVASLADIHKVLSTLKMHMNENALVLIEFVFLNQIQAYPYNHAFNRAIELINLLSTTTTEHTVKPDELDHLLRNDGFEIHELNTILPTFLTWSEKQLSSLILEANRELILQSKNAIPEELNSLLLELKEFENQEDTLICQPMLVQLSASLS